MSMGGNRHWGREYEMVSTILVHDCHLYGVRFYPVVDGQVWALGRSELECKEMKHILRKHRFDRFRWRVKERPVSTRTVQYAMPTPFPSHLACYSRSVRGKSTVEVRRQFIAMWRVEGNNIAMTSYRRWLAEHWRQSPHLWSRPLRIN